MTMAKSFARRHYFEVQIMLSVIIIGLIILMYFLDYRHLKTFIFYEKCHNSPILQHSLPAEACKRIPTLENVENVTVFYRKAPKINRCPLVKGRRILISFASDCCEKSQLINCQSGLGVGGFDICILFGAKSIDSQFQTQFMDPLLNQSQRGWAFWIWKPYIILKTLLELDDDDVLLYADVGSEFLGDFDSTHMCLQKKLDRDVQLYHVEHIEKNWTKPDAFILTGCRSTFCSDTKQILASFILLRRSFYSIRFISTWLAYATDERVLSDLPSTLVDRNPPYFIDHRHDQSLLSLIAKKWGLYEQSFNDPSQYGDVARSIRPDEFPELSEKVIFHTRMKA